MEVIEIDPWYSSEPAHFDLGMLDWGAAKTREFIDVFEDSLGADARPQYSLNWRIDPANRGNQWRRYRLLVMMLLTLRGTPVVDGLFGGPGDSRLPADPMPDSDESFLDHLMNLRWNCPALVLGDYRVLDSGADEIFVYVRETEMQRMIVLLNYSNSDFAMQVQGAVGEWVAGTHQVYGDGLPPEGGYVQLEGYEGRIYERRRSMA